MSRAIQGISAHTLSVFRTSSIISWNIFFKLMNHFICLLSQIDLYDNQRDSILLISNFLRTLFLDLTIVSLHDSDFKMILIHLNLGCGATPHFMHIVKQGFFSTSSFKLALFSLAGPCKRLEQQAGGAVVLLHSQPKVTLLGISSVTDFL